MLNLRTGLYECFQQGRMGFRISRIFTYMAYDKEHPKISSNAIWDAIKKGRATR